MRSPHVLVACGIIALAVVGYLSSGFALGHGALGPYTFTLDVVDSRGRPVDASSVRFIDPEDPQCIPPMMVAADRGTGCFEVPPGGRLVLDLDRWATGYFRSTYFFDLLGREERSGAYTLEVTAPGYDPVRVEWREILQRTGAPERSSRGEPIALKFEVVLEGRGV